MVELRAWPESGVERPATSLIRNFGFNSNFSRKKWEVGQRGNLKNRRIPGSSRAAADSLAASARSVIDRRELCWRVAQKWKKRKK